MPASFQVSTDPQRQILRITLSGFFDPTQFAAFDDARREAHVRLIGGPDRHDVLVDVRKLQLQAQQMVEAFRATITDPATRARRIAFVTGCGAIRMQVRRLLDRDGLRCFTDVAEAEGWLAEPAEAHRLAG